VQGQLREKPIASLMRDIWRQRKSGLLRLSKNKTIKAIFFESGVPVFAISNLSSDQLDHKLVQDGLVPADKMEEARRRANKPQRLGKVLVEMGLLAPEAVRNAACELARQIVLSVFEWDEGEYVFDDRIRAEHEVKLDWTAANCILEGARRAADIDRVAHSIAPPGAVLIQSDLAESGADFGGTLNSIESYVLSRVDAPTPVNQLAALTGLTELDVRRAVCALVAVGLLKRLGEESEEEAEEDRMSAQQLREELSRKMHFFANADFYEVLGVSRHATMGEIKRAYYQLAKQFHPDRYRRPEYSSLRPKLEAVFARITQAYQALSDPAQRAAYDSKLKSAGATETGPLKVEEPAARQVSVASQIASEQTEAVGQESKGIINPSYAAEYYYQQGRSRYEQKDFYAAIQLLRQAVKLDPSKPHYHFHLGRALMRNPRARREAEKHLLKAAELDPYNAQIQVQLGLLYKEGGLARKAEQCFRHALSLDPENRIALRELGGEQKKKEDSGSLWRSDLGSLAKKLFKK
jgi:curved DNA-binding protein CbpA